MADRDAEATILRQIADVIWRAGDELENGNTAEAAFLLKDLANGFGALASEID